MLLGLRKEYYPKVDKMARQLIHLGLDPKYFKNAMFDGFMKSKEGIALKADFAQLQKNSVTFKNKDIIVKLNQLKDEDQKLTYQSYADPKNPEIDKKFKEIYKKFRQYNDQYDIFSQQVIGIQSGDSGTAFYSDFGALFIHAFEDKDTTLFQPLLDAIQNGKIRSAEGLSFLEFTDSFRFIHRIYTHNDTLFQLVNKLPKYIADFSDATPNEKATYYSDYLYVDAAQNIIDKLHYVYHRQNCHKCDTDLPFTFGMGNYVQKQEKMVPFYRENQKVIGTCK